MLLALAGWSQPGFAQEGAAREPRLDLTENGVVDGADAAKATVIWAALAGTGGCGSSSAADLNGDGCVDVRDVQRFAGAVNAPAPADAQAAQQSEPAIWTVRSTKDDADASPGDGVCATADGACTLRAAIAEANRSPRPDRIEFNITGAGGSCPNSVVIAPKSTPESMLALDDPAGFGTVIDGYTQCGAKPNSEPVTGNAVIKIELYGSFDLDVHGIEIFSPNNVIRGLALYNWDRQIGVFGRRARYNRIEGNFLGTNGAQRFNSQNMGTHHSEGIRIQDGSYNIIGCGSFDAANTFIPCSEPQAWAARNIVAGNGNDGVHLELEGTVHNRIVGNYIGLKQDGVTPLPNKSDGVDIEQDPRYNWLGGLTPAERNIISGNNSEGIEISHGTDTQFNHVVGNYFGLDATGTQAVPNKGNGISFEDTVDQNYAYQNVVSGNNQSGFRFYVLATRNEVRNNLIGVAADGITPLANRHHGVHVMGGSQFNLIAENLIANNVEHGFYLASTSDAANNYVGETYFNTLRRNSVFNNGKVGIELYGRQGKIPNQNLARPVLLRANTIRVEGTACAGCLVELFVADKTSLDDASGDNHGEGKTFIGEARADGAGRFMAQVPELALGQILTATATDDKGNTSAFARNIAVTDVAVGDPTPTPTEPVTITTTPGVEITVTPTTQVPPTATTNPNSPSPTPTRGIGNAPEPRLWLPLLAK